MRNFINSIAELFLDVNDRISSAIFLPLNVYSLQQLAKSHTVIKRHILSYLTQGL